jgi:hypothetical protein
LGNPIPCLKKRPTHEIFYSDKLKNFGVGIEPTRTRYYWWRTICLPYIIFFAAKIM